MKALRILFLAVCATLLAMLGFQAGAQAATGERVLILPRDGSLVLSGKPPNIYCSAFSPSIDIRPVLEEGLQALLPGSRISTGAFTQGAGVDAPIRVAVEQFSWECSEEGDIIARLALSAQRTAGVAWNGRASGQKTGRWPGARECGTIPCAEQKFRQFFDPIVNALVVDMTTQLAGRIREGTGTAVASPSGAAQAPVAAKPAVESTAKGIGVPLYEVPSPLLRPDRTAAREILREVGELLAVATKSPKPDEYGSLQSELQRLIHLQVLLGDRAAYVQSIANLVELESRDPHLTAGIGGNLRIERLFPVMLRTGDQRMATILANAQIRIIRSKPEWSSLQVDRIAFLEKILEPAEDVLGLINLSAPPGLLCKAVQTLASIGRRDVAITLLDRIGKTGLTNAQCSIILDPYQIADGDQTRFETYLAAVTAAMPVDPETTISFNLHQFAIRMAVVGRFDIAREMAAKRPDPEQAGSTSAVISAAFLQSGRLKDALAAYLKSGRGGQSNELGHYGMETLPCFLEAAGDSAGAHAAFEHAIRGRGIDKSWKGCLAEAAGQHSPKRLAYRGDIPAAVAAARAWGKQMGSGDSTKSEQFWVSTFLLDVAFVAVGDIGLYDLFSSSAL